MVLFGQLTALLVKESLTAGGQPPVVRECEASACHESQTETHAKGPIK